MRKQPPKTNLKLIQTAMRECRWLHAMEHVITNLNSDPQLTHEAQLLQWFEQICKSVFGSEIGLIIEKLERFKAFNTKQDQVRQRHLVILYCRNQQLSNAKQLIAKHESLADLTTLLQKSMADFAITQKQKALLPEAYHADYDTILQAFQLYHNKLDDQAREKLQLIGIQSPFIDWKLFLRGLLAFLQREDARAIENWKRLDPILLPSQFAAVFRVGIDPEYRSNQSSNDQVRTQQGQAKIYRNSWQLELRQLQGILRAKSGLKLAFRAISHFKHTMKKAAPQLYQRLGVCFYYLLKTDGRPDDLPKYVMSFGHPPRDPDFFLLQSRVFADIDEPLQAFIYSACYENWLAKNAKLFPTILFNKIQEILNINIGKFAEMLDLNNGKWKYPEDSVVFMALTKKHKIQPSLNSFDYFQKASAFDPESEEPILMMLETTKITQIDQCTATVKIAEKYLETHPDALKVYQAFGLFLLQHKLVNAYPILNIWQQILRIDPFNRLALLQTFHEKLRQAMALLPQKKWQAALGLLDNDEAEHSTLTFMMECFRQCILEKSGDAALAEQLYRKLKEHSQPAVYSLIRAVFHIIIKVKPTERTQYNNAFYEHLSKIDTVMLLLNCGNALMLLEFIGITYTGVKTYHSKFFAKLQSMKLDFKDNAQLTLVKRFLLILEKNQQYAGIQKWLKQYERSRNLPAFIEFYLHLSTLETKKQISESKLSTMLRKLNYVKHRIQESDDPEDQFILPKIDETIAKLPTDPFSMLDILFRSRR